MLRKPAVAVKPSSRLQKTKLNSKSAAMAGLVVAMLACVPIAKAAPADSNEPVVKKAGASKSSSVSVQKAIEETIRAAVEPISPRAIMIKQARKVRDEQVARVAQAQQRRLERQALAELRAIGKINDNDDAELDNNHGLQLNDLIRQFADTCDHFFNGSLSDPPRWQEQMERLLAAEISRANAITPLSASEREKLKIAGLGDINHLTADIDDALATISEADLLQNGFPNVLGLFEPLRFKTVYGPFVASSLFAKTLTKIRREHREQP